MVEMYVIGTSVFMHTHMSTHAQNCAIKKALLSILLKKKRNLPIIGQKNKFPVIKLVTRM